MNYVFFGTPEFAAIVLGKLISAGYIPGAIICNPDEPVGRKQILTPPPVKSFIMEHGTWNIKIFQPIKLDSSFKFQVSGLKPDLAIVAAYGKIIPKEILEIPRLRQGFGGQATYGFLNVHPSLLPKYRGPSPIQSAILNGDKETGITIMKVDEEMDHGPVISNVKIQISNYETYEGLSQRLAISGAELLIKIIPDYISGRIKPVEQDHFKATYTKVIKKEDGKIDWSKSAEEIERMTRAFYPWPTAWTIWKGKTLKILEAEVNGSNLVIKKLQLEGGKVLSIKEFLNGHKDFNMASLK